MAIQGVIETTRKQLVSCSAGEDEALWATICTPQGAITVHVIGKGGRYTYNVDEERCECPDGRSVGGYKRIASGQIGRAEDTREEPPGVVFNF